MRDSGELLASRLCVAGDVLAVGAGVCLWRAVGRAGCVGGMDELGALICARLTGRPRRGAALSLARRVASARTGGGTWVRLGL